MFQMQGVRSLVRELRSHVVCGKNKLIKDHHRSLIKKKENKNLKKNRANIHESLVQKSNKNKIYFRHEYYELILLCFSPL